MGEIYIERPAGIPIKLGRGCCYFCKEEDVEGMLGKIEIEVPLTKIKYIPTGIFGVSRPYMLMEGYDTRDLSPLICYNCVHAASKALKKQKL